jgi:predicted phosphodiesterase
MLRVIGDVHGRYKEYLKIASESEYSLQVGDMGFNYGPLSPLDSSKHVFLGGNHDNYDEYYKTPHVITSSDGSKDYGSATLGGVDFFFVRGGYSIDKQARLRSMAYGGPPTYWFDEELKDGVFIEALEAYKNAKPEVMVTHECPKILTSIVGDDRILESFGIDPLTFSTLTSSYLQRMFLEHKPQLWIFGHYHKDWSYTVDGTQFICLQELGFLDLNIS